MIMRRKWPDTRVTGGSGDGTKDAISYDVEGNLVAVGQAKHTASVGGPVLRETLGAAVESGATNVVLATSGQLTKQARDSYESHLIEGQTYAWFPTSGLRLYVWDRRRIVQWLNDMPPPSWVQFRWEVIDGLDGFSDTPEPSDGGDKETEIRVRTALGALGQHAEAWRDHHKRVSRARKSLNELDVRFGDSQLLREVGRALYEV